MTINGVTYRLLNYEGIALLAKITHTGKDGWKWRVKVRPATYAFDFDELGYDDDEAYPLAYVDFFVRKPSDKDIMDNISVFNEHLLDWREYEQQKGEYDQKTK